MLPLVTNAVPSYFICWLLAAGAALLLGVHLARREGFPTGRSALALLLFVVIVLVGSKLLYVAETLWFPADDYVPLQMRTLRHGFRVPGGMLLLALGFPIVCPALDLSWKRFGDTIIPVAAIALVLVRLGCFLNGCCFGAVTTYPWAVSFKSIYIARSTDGGINFGPQVVLAQAPYVVPPPISLENICQAIPFLNGFVGVKFWGNIAADPLVDNNVYAVWQSWDETLQSSEIYFSASTQGGQAATWSAPVRINDVTTGDQFFPRIATNVFHASPPDKTQLKVIWYDRRLDPQNLSVHVFGDTSFNAGAAWQNDVRWSTIASPLPDIKVNFDCNWGGACYFGDYNGLSTMGPGSDLFVAAWGDTRPPLASGTPCNTYPSPQPDPNVMTAVGC